MVAQVLTGMKTYKLLTLNRVYLSNSGVTIISLIGVDHGLIASVATVRVCTVQTSD